VKLLYISVLIVTVVGQSQAANLIKDGSFETPATPAGHYTVYQPGQELGPWTVVGSHHVNTSSTTGMNLGIILDAKQGLAFLDLTGDCDCGDPTEGVAQTVKTVRGTSYTLSFWVRNCYIPGAGTTSTGTSKPVRSSYIRQRTTEGREARSRCGRSSR